MKKEIVKGNSKEYRTIFNFPSMPGDMTCWLGRTIVTMIQLNCQNDVAYSIETSRRNTIELLAAVLKELNVSPKEIQQIYDNEIKD